MASAGPRRGAIIEGVNVTPLVDVTLVLLVIFIVTAKMVVMPAVPLDLPKASQSEELQTILSVVVPARGQTQIDGVAVSEEEVITKARVALAGDPELRAVIQADKAVPHGRVLGVMDALKSAGLARVAFGAVRPEAPPQEVARHVAP